MNKPAPPLAVGLAACSLALAGCGGGSNSPTPAPSAPAPAAPAQVLSYAITDLGAPPGTVSFYSASGISASGAVVGTSYADNDSISIRAFIWQSGQVQDLGILPGGRSSGVEAISTAGQAVGSATVAGPGPTPPNPPPGPAGNEHACLFQNGQVQDLGTLPDTDPGGGNSYAYGVNDSGQVVGQSDVTNGGHSAFLWQSGRMQNLGTLPDGYEGFAYAAAINDAGQIVGVSATATQSVYHAFLWQSGQMHDLGTLPGQTQSVAYAINAGGQAVGDATAADGRTHACLFRGGQVQDLGTLPGQIESSAAAINAAGLIVGGSNSGSTASTGATGAGRRGGRVSTLPPGTYSAFVWQNGQMRDLNALIPANSGWVLQEANGVNDRGQICGNGTLNNQFRAFLLTPAGPAAQARR